MGSEQIMTFRGMAVSQDVFRDFCDPTGFLPKEKVADAVRCLGENPLQSEIREITNKFKSQGLNFQQFEEVVKIYKNMNQSPNDELSESLAVFDVDGEGLVPMSQIKHLICSEDSGGWYGQGGGYCSLATTEIITEENILSKSKKK